MLDVNFVFKADVGAESAFAETARPGDQISIFSAEGSSLVEANWYLLAGDETTLPAFSSPNQRITDYRRSPVLCECLCYFSACTLWKAPAEHMLTTFEHLEQCLIKNYHF